MEKKRFKLFLKNIFDELKVIVITVIITFLFITFVAQPAITCGDSMNNTLNSSDVVIMEKITKEINAIKRFDVIVFDCLDEHHSKYIKRVIGLPGDTVRIDGSGKIYVNDVLLEESYGNETILDAGIASQTIKIGEEQYFVLGDNRNNSLDSRFEEIGLVNKSQIKGRVMFAIYPPKKVK